jgi:hypothetical protein
MSVVTLNLASAQPRIEHASHEWIEMFGLGLHADAVNGRTLAVVQGPETDVREVTRLMQTVQHGKAAQARLVLYSGAGAAALYNVRASPSSCFERCHITMSRYDAISHEEALREDGKVKVLVRAARPFKVAHVSCAFSEAYGIAPEHFLNRTLALVQGPNTRHRALAELFDAALQQQGSTHATNIVTYRGDGTEVGRDLAHVSVQHVMSGGDLSHLLVVMGKDPRADVFPAPKEFDIQEGHADVHDDLGPPNNERLRSSEGRGAARSCDALASERLRRGKGDQEYEAEQRRQRRPQHTRSTQTTPILEAPAGRLTAAEAPEADNAGLCAMLTSMLCFVIGVLVSIATWGAVPMPWAQTHLQTSRRVSSRRDERDTPGGLSARVGARSPRRLRAVSPRAVMSVTRRAAYLREWELVHHGDFASSVLENFTVY